MALTDDTIEADATGLEPAPSAPAKHGGHGDSKPGLTAGGVFRFLVLAALVAFLLIYVGVGPMIETAIKVALAVGLSAALFVGANLLFNQAYDRWTLFNTIVGGVCGFLGYAILDNNRLLRSLFDDRVEILGQGPFDINAWLWGLIGGASLALVFFLLSAPRSQMARLPLATVGVGAFGLLTALAFDDDARPSIDFAAIGIWVGLLAVLFGVVGLLRHGAEHALKSALTGVGVGWLIGAWGGGDVGDGNLAGVMYATLVPAVILGVRFGLATPPDANRRRRIEQKSRAWIFLTPALTFITAGLVIPLIKTIYMSFRNRDNSDWVGLDNYQEIFDDPNSFNLDNWSNFVTSQLFWIAIGMVAVGIIAGLLTGKRTQQKFEKGEASMIPIWIGFFLLACAVLSTVRGTIFNNIWWVIVVTALSTAFGLGVAVLADRAKGENIAKSLIFLPMAISFVGAGIIWRFMYIARPEGDTQTGVLNAIWVWLGDVSDSGTGTAIAVALLAILAGALIWLIRTSLRDKKGGTAGAAIGFLIVTLFFIWRFLGPGIGGFQTNAQGETIPRPILFVQETPFNNMWLMVILIWIQTGFAMVILSAAIKAVPTELTEAAKIDGATESQIFWRVTVPQIAPTIGVVVTTLIVTVMKVFDIVKVTTNGNFDTQVIANQMFTAAFGNSNEGLGGALATILFISVLPVMYINIRRMQSQRA